jgi:murein DD-endopeptidase MepM/ murein hydrolase activator NlpD
MNGVTVPAQHLADTEILPIDQALTLAADGNEVLNVALMQGFLTLPFSSEEYELLFEADGYDHDGRVGYKVAYNGDTSLIRDDGHVGWDYGVPVGTFVLASNPGRLESWESATANGTSINAGIRTGLPRMQGEHEPMTVYGHLANLLSEQDGEVLRGQIIAASGESGTMWPHLHFDFLCGPPNPVEPDDYIPNGYQKDPFGVIPGIPVSFPLERYSSWTVFNDPRSPL